MSNQDDNQRDRQQNNGDRTSHERHERPDLHERHERGHGEIIKGNVPKMENPPPPPKRDSSN